MKSFIIILLSLAGICPAYSQVVTESPLNNTKRAPMDTTVYYRRPGAFVMNLSNYMINPVGTVSMPVTLGFDATLAKDFSLGMICTYLVNKNITQLSDNVAVVNDNNINYHEVTVGVKSTYHLMPLIQSMSRKPLMTDYVDVYVSGWAGYSMVMAGGPSANIQYMEANEKLRGGLAVGVRSMVMPRFGFFVEGGYSSYGFLSFGMTARIK